MTTAELIPKLKQVNTSLEERKVLLTAATTEAKVLQQIFQIGKKDKEYAAKALRALELIAIKEPIILFPMLDELISLAGTAKKDAEVRPLAKIIELFVEKHFSAKENIYLTDFQIQKITSVCFDWLVENHKTATKVYAMQVLFQIGKITDWVHPQLEAILEKDLISGSAGYKARGRKILQKLK